MQDIYTNSLKLMT